MWFVNPYKIGATLADNVLKHGVGADNEKAFLRYVEKPGNVIKCGLDKRESGLHPTQKSVRQIKSRLLQIRNRHKQVLGHRFDCFNAAIDLMHLNEFFAI